MNADPHFASSPVAHLEVALDGQILRTNDACVTTFNRAQKELVGKPLASLFTSGPTGRTKIERLLEVVGADAEETTFVRGDGSQRWGRVFAWPIPDASGPARSLQVLVLDITDDRRFQIALEESEARFRTLGDSAPVLLWMSGRDARCTFFNQRWLEFTGRTMEQEVGDGWAEGIHAEDFQHCMHTYTESFVRREPFRMEYRFRRADGLYRWVLDTGLPRHLPDGSFAGFIGSCIDVTDFKEANEALRRLKAQLEERVVEAQAAVQARDEFLSIASHELRTPLTALVLQLASLRGAILSTDSTKLSTKMDKAMRATERLTTLVDNLLDVSRIATGSLELELEECDLGVVARDLLDRVSDAAKRAECELDVRVAPAVVGSWDRMRLEQVLENLLGNAMKYGPGKPIEVTISDTKTTASVSVRDHGIGISKNDIERIFGRFERAVPAKNYGGLGLGLYITRQIVVAHHGAIHVTSKPGDGALFVVELPKRPELADAMSG